MQGPVQRVDGRCHRGHRDDADDDAQGGQHGTQFVGANGIPGDEQSLFDFEQEIHNAA
jgi:hypothetical protein